MSKHVELIIDYIVQDDGSLQYNDTIGKIVRCKDCRWFDKSKCIEVNDSCEYLVMQVTENDFCRYGEEE